MSWDFCDISRQTARKNYNCSAMDWIENADDLDELSAEELAAVEKARDEGGMILKGQEYLKVSGKWDGEWSVFRARPEIDAICKKHDFYYE